MQSNPKVSVILTSFNHAKYLREAIDSTLNQTFSDFELIIWDDASVDNSWEIIRSYSDPRIKGFRNEIQMRGIHGINKSISEVAQGEFIAIHHSDDIWELDKLEKQVRFLDANSEIGAVFTNVNAVNEDGILYKDKEHFYYKIFDQPNRTRHEWLRFFFINDNALCHPSILIRKSCYDDCGVYRYGMAQLGDFDMWTRLCLKYEIHVLPERLVKFRVRENNANTSGDKPDARVRHAYEYSRILHNFRDIDSYIDFVKVFPEVNNYCDENNFDADYAFAMVCLELKPRPQALLLAQDILFDVINNPVRSERILQNFGFDYIRFISLSAQNDIYAIESLRELNENIEKYHVEIDERDNRVRGLINSVSDRDVNITQLAHEIAELRDSTSWRITAPYRVFGHEVKRLKHIIKLCIKIFRHHGGVKETTAKIYRMYKKNGLKGIQQKFLGIVKNSAKTQVILPDGRCVDHDDYQEWIYQYDTLTDEARAVMCAHIEAFAHKPLISVVMPTYNPKPEWLAEAIESVRRQIYPHWELCIADDVSTDQTIRSILERYAKEDSRIKVVFRKQNGHISAASNSALELVTGEWVALLDHDDLLSEHALFWVADAINQNPGIRLVYSDEDKIDEVGRRFDPYFKTDWNVDLFYSQNMFSHLGVYHADLLRDINGFREGLEGAQDYDLALRCSERIDAKQIHHIPRVLYHWRMHAESTAQSTEAKPYAMLAGERALNEHFQRQRINAKSEFVGYGYRTHYALPDSPPLVSLIIPTRNGLQLLRQCVEGILEKTIYPNYEILIVDNGSDDPATLKYLQDLQVGARVRVVRDDRPFNYSALNNAAVKLAQGEVVGLLNNDLEVISPEWLSEMVSIALQPGSGTVGARLWYPNDTLQHGGVLLGVGGVANHAHLKILRDMHGYFARASLIQSFSAVTAACLVIRKEIYEQVEGLNEIDLTVAFNDVDFCLRVRAAGYRNVWTPYAELYHHESATRGFENTPEKQARFAKEVNYMKQCWGDVLLNDPCYNPNLTLDHEDFSLAWPPRIE